MAARSRRDLVARDRLVERYLRLAYMLARRYSRTSEPLKDLEQVACLGLVHAVDRFDPDRGTAFSTFAVPTILGELRRHFRDRTWSVRVPRDLRDAATAVEEDGGATLGDRIRAGEDELRRAEDSILVRQLAAASLSERDREVLRLRFEEGLLQREIAARVGVSQTQVSRILRDSLRRLQLVARQGAAPPAGGAVLPRRDARDPIVRLEGPVGRGATWIWAAVLASRHVGGATLYGTAARSATDLSRY